MQGRICVVVVQERADKCRVEMDRNKRPGITKDVRLRSSFLRGSSLLASLLSSFDSSCSSVLFFYFRSYFFTHHILYYVVSVLRPFLFSPPFSFCTSKSGRKDTKIRPR